MEEKHVDPKVTTTNLSINHISESDVFRFENEEAPEILVTDLRSLPIVQSADQNDRKN